MACSSAIAGNMQSPRQVGMRPITDTVCRAEAGRRDFARVIAH